MIEVLLLSLALNTADADCAVSLGQARMAYAALDVAEAQARYAAVAGPACTAQQQSDAVIESTRLSWLIGGAAAVDLERFRMVVDGHPEPCAGAKLLVRILAGADRGDEAIQTADRYRARCAPLDPAFGLEAGQVLAARAAGAQGEARAHALDDLRGVLAGSGALGAMSPLGARLRLDLGLLSGNAAEALEGWRAFYWLQGTLAPAGFGKGDAEIADIMRNGVGTRNEQRLADLASLMVRAGFAQEAGWIADLGSDRSAPQWRSIDAYLAMRADLTATLLEHDRARARDKAFEDPTLDDRLTAILHKGLADAGRDQEDPWPALEDEWGLVGITGRTLGVQGLHLGHASERLDDEVSQEGRRGRVRFATVDNMVANSFSAWLGDGAFAPGGWTSNGRIIQVRQSYVDLALNTALAAEEGPARERVSRRIGAARDQDIAAARTQAIAYLPSVADRLRLQAIDQIATEVRIEPDTGQPMPVRIARRWYDRSFESAMTLHEGRHALDEGVHSGDAVLDSPELEYRAKISEIGYSRSPRVGLVNVYTRLLGGASGHGIANARIIGDIVGWMETHRPEIVGYDPDLPALAQLDLLSDDQLRAIVLAHDPERAAAGAE